MVIAGLHPQSNRHFVWQSSARVSQTLRTSYFNHVTAVTTQEDEYWHHYRSGCRNTTTYAHTTLRTFLTYQPSLTNFTWIRGWRLCEMNPVLTVNLSWLEEVRVNWARVCPVKWHSRFGSNSWCGYVSSFPYLQEKVNKLTMDSSPLQQSYKL